MAQDSRPVVLDVKDLKTYFYTRRGIAKAVDGVSFQLHQGETLGLVGESACGKSVTALSVIRLVPQPSGRIVGGEMIFQGEDLLQKPERDMRNIRGKQIAMILQDPMTSLDPVFTIGDQVGEPIRFHQPENRKNIMERVVEMLRAVKIPAPEIRVREYPHQMSGGMRQRIVAAMAISCTPQLLIADEPTTSLDVTIQAQLLKLLNELKTQSKLAMLIITHDFGIVARVCDRVAVMYAGRIVETADVRTIFKSPLHPYTQALIGSVPKVGARVERLFSIEGQPPDVRAIPPGCPFAPRCSQAMDICREKYPETTVVGDGHLVNCWLMDKKN
ncbi:MAG: ABC transporter ATP-binding protein [Dehalococcoidia bacterium]|nr:ABC transporter ATP-binding protein [Dehalococcoidia bacterium]